MEENDRNGWDHQHRLSPSYSSSVELKVVLLGGGYFFLILIFNTVNISNLIAFKLQLKIEFETVSEFKAALGCVIVLLLFGYGAVFTFH